MNRTMTLLAGAGLGAGLAYLLDPQLGRRRRALVRDKMIRVLHECEDAVETVACDFENRLQGLRSGDLSVLVGGKQALHGDPLRGSWSPSGRALLALVGGGLFLSGLMRNAPMACVLGTAGLALMAEGATNAGVDDLQRLTACATAAVGETAEASEGAPEPEAEETPAAPPARSEPKRGRKARGSRSARGKR